MSKVPISNRKPTEELTICKTFVEELDHLLYNVYQLDPVMDARVIKDTTNGLVIDCTKLRDSNCTITVGWLRGRVAFYIGNVKILRTERKRRMAKEMHDKLMGRKNA